MKFRKYQIESHEIPLLMKERAWNQIPLDYYLNNVKTAKPPMPPEIDHAKPVGYTLIARMAPVKRYTTQPPTKSS